MQCRPSPFLPTRLIAPVSRDSTRDTVFDNRIVRSTSGADSNLSLLGRLGPRHRRTPCVRSLCDAPHRNIGTDRPATPAFLPSNQKTPFLEMDDDSENRWRKAANARWERFKKQQSTGDKKAKGGFGHCLLLLGSPRSHLITLIFRQSPSTSQQTARQLGRWRRRRWIVPGRQARLAHQKARRAPPGRNFLLNNAIGSRSAQATTQEHRKHAKWLRHSWSRRGQPVAPRCQCPLGKAQAPIGAIDPRWAIGRTFSQHASPTAEITPAERRPWCRRRSGIGL